MRGFPIEIDRANLELAESRVSVHGGLIARRALFYFHFRRGIYSKLRLIRVNLGA